MTAPLVDAQPVVDTVLAAVTAQGVAVGDGAKPAVAAGRPWVVAWPDPGSVGDKSLLSRDGFSMVVTFQCYGLSPASARFAVRKVRAAVIGLRGTTVAGQLVHLPEHLIAPPMERDDDADPPIWWQVDEWRLRLA